jgi:hypothetical protein
VEDEIGGVAVGLSQASLAPVGARVRALTETSRGVARTHNMSRRCYLRSILSNSWSRDLYLVLTGAGGGVGRSLPVEAGLGGPNKRLCVCVYMCMERISERVPAPLASNPPV